MTGRYGDGPTAFADGGGQGATAPTIAARLEQRNAWLSKPGGLPGDALARRTLNGAVWQGFGPFRRLFDEPNATVRSRDIERALGRTGIGAGVDAGLFVADDEAVWLTPAGRRWATGGWLEEFAFATLVEAGADEAFYAQPVRWSGRFGDDIYQNEIDVLAREGDRLIFVSAKAARPNAVETPGGDDRLFQAMLEVDYWRRHFGSPDDAAVLITTADFFEERKRVRHPGLTERAAVLDVALVPADARSAAGVVERMRDILAT